MVKLPQEKLPGQKSKKQPEENKSLKQQETKLSSQDPKKEKKPPWKEICPPEKEDLASSPSSPDGGEEDEKKEPVEERALGAVCGDILATGFLIWNHYDKDIEPLAEDRKKILSPYLAHMAEKYHADRILKDEIIFFGLLGSEIYQRIRMKKKAKKHDDRHSGQKTTGQDNPDEVVNPESPV